MLFSYLNLQACDIADGKAENAAQGHQEPEVEAGLVLKPGDNGQLPKEQHKWYEENAGIHVVVKGQSPDIILKKNWNVLCKCNIWTYLLSYTPHPPINT